MKAKHSACGQPGYVIGCRGFYKTFKFCRYEYTHFLFLFFPQNEKCDSASPINILLTMNQMNSSRFYKSKPIFFRVLWWKFVTFTIGLNQMSVFLHGSNSVRDKPINKFEIKPINYLPIIFYTFPLAVNQAAVVFCERSVGPVKRMCRQVSFKYCFETTFPLRRIHY